MLGQYVGVVEMECQCLIDMINQHVLPDCKTAGLSTAGIEGALASLEAGLHGVHAACVHAAAPCPSCMLLCVPFSTCPACRGCWLVL